MDSWKITCHSCSQLPFNPVEAPCCGAVYCWECVLNVPQCKGCGLELSPELCKPATAIEKLVQAQRNQKGGQDNGRMVPPTRDTKVACPECGVTVAYIRMEEHLALCPRVEVACPNKCGLQLKRDEISDHVTNICPLTVLPCPYGCDTSNNPLTRYTLQAHLDQNTNAHLQHLAKKVAEQDKTINTLKSFTFCPQLKGTVSAAWSAFQDDTKRQQWLKAHVPPRTLFTLVLLCLGLLMLSTLPFLMQVIFLLVFLKKHPKGNASTPTTRALFRLKAFAAVSFFFAFSHFPFWLLLLTVGPVAYLIYLSRDDIIPFLQPILNA